MSRPSVATRAEVRRGRPGPVASFNAAPAGKQSGVIHQDVPGVPARREASNFEIV